MRYDIVAEEVGSDQRIFTHALFVPTYAKRYFEDDLSIISREAERKAFEAS